jgi:hypothetical protein
MTRLSQEKTTLTPKVSRATFVKSEVKKMTLPGVGVGVTNHNCYTAEAETEIELRESCTAAMAVAIAVTLKAVVWSELGRSWPWP